jgi:hypothetical protein
LITKNLCVRTLGPIPVEEELANEFDHYWRHCIDPVYGKSINSRLKTLCSDIDSILKNASLGSKNYDESTWVGDAFTKHPTWGKIREMSRSYFIGEIFQARTT